MLIFAYGPFEINNGFILQFQIVSQAPDLQSYAVHEAWKAIRDTENCTEKQPLTQVACWYVLALHDIFLLLFVLFALKFERK